MQDVAETQEKDGLKEECIEFYDKVSHEALCQWCMSMHPCRYQASLSPFGCCNCSVGPMMGKFGWSYSVHNKKNV